MSHIDGLQPMFWGLQGLHGDFGGAASGEGEVGALRHGSPLPTPSSSALSVSRPGFFTWPPLSEWLCGLSGWGLRDPDPACNFVSEESEDTGGCAWPKVTWWLGASLCAF